MKKVTAGWDDRKLIEDEIEKFPSTFGLRAFPGKVFTISEQKSYFSQGRIVLCTAVYDEEQGRWLDFAEGSPEEVRREIVDTDLEATVDDFKASRTIAKRVTASNVSKIAQSDGWQPMEAPPLSDQAFEFFVGGRGNIASIDHDTELGIWHLLVYNPYYSSKLDSVDAQGAMEEASVIVKELFTEYLTNVIHALS